jgi:hypothetical protein
MDVLDLSPFYLAEAKKLLSKCVHKNKKKGGGTSPRVSTKENIYGALILCLSACDVCIIYYPSACDVCILPLCL